MLQVHEARSAELLRLFAEVDHANSELRRARESPLLAGSADLRRPAQLERRRADGHRQKPPLQDVPLRQFSEQEGRLPPTDCTVWRDDRQRHAAVQRQTNASGLGQVAGTWTCPACKRLVTVL